MAILEEIRRQPRHVRELLYGLCVITAVALIGLAWFRSFEKRVFVALNPDVQLNQERSLARQSERSPSLFGLLMSTFRDLKAQLGTLLENEESSEGINSPEQSITSSSEPRPLPTSDSR